jgi:soluble lytic murein transglycosylase-like protein
MRIGRSAVDLALVAAFIGTVLAGGASHAGTSVWTRSDAAESDDSVDRWDGLIEEAAARFGVPVEWIRAVMRAESGGRTKLDGRPIISSAGAMGLMQVMPETYEMLRRRYGLGDDPYDPRDNVMAGAAYLRELYDLFGYPDLFAAYNAGPERLRDRVRAGRSLPAETLGYLATLDRLGLQQASMQGVSSGVHLFFTLHAQSAAPNAFGRDQRARALFIPLRTSPAGSG